MDELFPEYDRMVSIVGKRHATCELNNFVVGDGQYATRRRAALTAVTDYCKKISENVAAGKNIILYGLPGTGKDHLAVSVIRVALMSRLTAISVRGSALAAEMRAYQCEKGAKTSFPLKYAERDILLLSDAEPRVGDEKASAFEIKAFLELIDQRYKDMRPIIITSNIERLAVLEQKIGDAALDRLTENCVVIHTDWPSYRQRGKKCASA